ncbi:hypothetical protein UNH65_03360 [Chitinophaga sp. 180180018-2]|nr:hypothetical protein [Chitinophaga sp. 212800010-3]
MGYQGGLSLTKNLGDLLRRTNSIIMLKVKITLDLHKTKKNVNYSKIKH